MRNPGVLLPGEVLEIFRRKTAPAFEVALRLGAIIGGAGDDVCEILKRFSAALGTAYQIRDDLCDFEGEGEPGDAVSARPSIVFALACEKTGGNERERVAAAWRGSLDPAGRREVIAALAADERLREKANQLLEHYKNEAIRSLAALQNAHLKSLLRRFVGKILKS